MGDTLKLRLLSSEQVSTMRERCLYLLSTMGMRIDHDGALRILDGAGADVDRETHVVRFPVDLIETALGTVPSELTVKGADPSHDCPIPHPDGLFYSCTNIQSMLHHDVDSGRFVDNTAEKFAEWCQLIEVLDHADICAIQTPMDVPAESAEVHALSIQMQNTTKPLWMHAFSLEAVPFMFELMVTRMGGVEALRAQSVAIINPGTVSPFIMKAMDAEEIIQACHHGVPISADGHVMAGFVSPDDGRRQRRAELRRSARTHHPQPGRQARPPGHDDPVQRPRRHGHRLLHARDSGRQHPALRRRAAVQGRLRDPGLRVPDHDRHLRLRRQGGRGEGPRRPDERHGGHGHRLRRGQARRRQSGQSCPAGDRQSA